MKVSIVVPVYRVEKYIEQCAVSLFEQTYDDLEFVFVDDCSPDHSREILQQVADSYPQRKEQVKIIRLPQNGGSGNARRVGVEQSTGEYISFVDSDDVAGKNMIELFVKKAKETHADVIDGAYAYLTDQGIGDTIPPSSDKQQTYLRKLLLQYIVSHQIWARIIRRQFMMDQKIFFQPGVNQGEDYSITPRLLLKARWTTIPDIIYYYRIDRVGTFTNHLLPHHAVSYIKANGIVSEFFKQHDTTNTYTTALQIGLLHAYSIGAHFDISYQDLQTYCPFSPKGLYFRCFLWLTKKKCPWKFLRFLYLAAKRTYRIFL